MSSAPASKPAARKEQRHGSSATLRDMIIVALYYRKMVAAIIAAGFVLAILAFLITPVRHTARLQLMLLGGSQTASMLGLSTGNLAIDTGRAANSEAELLRSRELLSLVVEKLGSDKINPDFGNRRLFGLLPRRAEDRQVNDAIDSMENQLKVTTPPDTNLLVVAFTHKDREMAITIVDTLVHLYLERRSEIYSMEKGPLLKQKAQSYSRQLAAIEDELKAEKAKNGILDLPREITLAVDELSSSSTRLRTLVEHRSSLSAEINASQARLSQLPPQVMEYVETTDRVDNNETDNKLTKLFVEHDHLEKYYQPDDPRRLAVDQEIDSLRQAEHLPKHLFTIDRKVRNPSVDFLNNHLMQLQIEADAAKETQTELEQQVTSAQKRVEQLRDAQSTIESLERSRAVTDALYRDFTQRAEIQQSQEAASAGKDETVRIVSNAESSLKGESGRVNIALATMVGAIVVAFSGALVSDWNRQVLLLPQEIEELMDMPVLATFTDGQSLISPSIAPSIIFLAGQLIFHRPTGRGQSVQVVSSARNEYREDLAQALAMELASGQGVKTLLLDLAGDGTTHWTRLGKPEGTPSPFGFDLAPTNIPKLDVSCGAGGAGQDWLRVNKEELSALFTELGSRYEMIVIDAPPLQQNSTCVRLATMVDGSMIVLRAEQTRRSVAEHLREQLLSAGGSLYGMIMTGRKFYIPRMIYRWL